MSTCPYPSIEAVPATGSRQLSATRCACVDTCFAALGSLTLWPTFVALWSLWTTDALKSIGMVVPIVSFVLILRAWRSISWRSSTSLWGIPLVLLAIAASQLQIRALLLFVISPKWTTPLPPLSLPLVAYATGVLLLVGGRRLLRTALFPTLLLWFSNPVPHAFTLAVDLPLQRLSAAIARGFALHLGQTLTPDKLRLMFTPEFGMFIAPGCDGIRGAITMALITFVAGYVYRLRWHIWSLAVAASLLLGYLFNLLRLCMLVLYYLVALHFASLRHQAENADYVIGAVLFLCATLLLFKVLPRFRGEAEPPKPLTAPSNTGRPAALFVLATIALFGLVQIPSALAVIRLHRLTGDQPAQFPAHLGAYHLVRTWNETLSTNVVVYHWAQYAPDTGGPPISLGYSPVLGWHDPLICHGIRGEHPLWQGPLSFRTVTPAPISFSSALYNDGVTQHIEAATECTGHSCGEFATQRTHLGFVYSRLDPDSFLRPGSDRPIPVLIRIETLDHTLRSAAARQQFTQELKAFVSSADLQAITHPGSR